MKRKNILLFIPLLLTLALACNFASAFDRQADSQEEPPAAEESADSVPEAASEEAPASTASDNPCNNIFYPLIPGQQMVYKSSSPEGPAQTGITVARVEGNIATVDMLNLTTGITSQSTAECEAGAIKNYPSASLGSLVDNMVDGAVTMDYVSGYIAPAEETFITDNWTTTWTSEYVMNGEITVEQDGESVTVKIEDSPILMNWQIVGTGERLTVEAGTYTNAIRVTREMTMDAKLDMGLMAVDSTFEIKSTHWFEPYVGMLKTEITEVNVTAQGMTFPVAMDETMELIEFRPTE